MKKVVIGLSGGVDSAVSAYLLKKQGYHVIGVFMKNWDSVLNNDIMGHKNELTNGCNSNEDFLDAESVAEHLDIEFYAVDFTKEYWNKVFKYFIQEYEKSLTPNPDVLCNRYIKFDVFANYVFEKFKCDFVATGHYADLEENGSQTFLKLSKDVGKDQTYFLCWLKQRQLHNVIFPLGKMLKSEVRQLAKEQNIPVFNKKDSTGICFVGERDFESFLSNYVKVKNGNFVDIETNEIVGTHRGTMFYTIGQNKNLHLHSQKEKYFVCLKDHKKNIVYVVKQTSKLNYLTSNYCEIVQFSQNCDIDLTKIKNLKVRFRHRQKLCSVESLLFVNDKLILKYEPTESVAPGQFAVIYDEVYCYGGGIIESTQKK